jgi:hypothetical protein
VFAPPGLTPTIDDCAQTPCDPRCTPAPLDNESITYWGGGRMWIFRGGFGHYFWTAGG